MQNVRFLDVGCAWGVNTQKALELGATVIATDREEAHLAGLINGVTNREHLSRAFC